ncbi:Uncharacterised protein [uncultured archaeon]|nr:Uncharacterised protein [uncultured archaeon]
MANPFHVGDYVAGIKRKDILGRIISVEDTDDTDDYEYSIVAETNLTYPLKIGRSHGYEYNHKIMIYFHTNEVRPMTDEEILAYLLEES